MLRRIFWIVILAFAFSMVIPVRPAARMPQMTRVDAAALAQATEGEDLSLSRLLQLSGDENIYAFSAYCYGLPTDRLAAAQGLSEPSRVTVYFDGIRYLGVTTTYEGAGEYFDLAGRSAEQLDGMTTEQFVQERTKCEQTAKEKLEEASQNLHNLIVNVQSWN